jgi:stage V sporulation protein R
MNTLYDQDRITEGAMLEILHSHSSVVFQPPFDDKRFGGINPYALGFEMMLDIRRVCTDPTAEDREYLPDIAGNGDWRGTLRDAWANHRDESFIQQYLSPHLIRKVRLFVLGDDGNDSHYTVTSIHDDRGYDQVRRTIARNYDLGTIEPNIQVVDLDLRGDRKLCLQHTVRDGIPLAEKSRDEVLKHIRSLWGYDVVLRGVDNQSGETIYEKSTAEKASAA